MMGTPRRRLLEEDEECEDYCFPHSVRRKEYILFWRNPLMLPFRPERRYFEEEPQMSSHGTYSNYREDYCCHRGEQKDRKYNLPRLKNVPNCRRQRF